MQKFSKPIHAENGLISFPFSLPLPKNAPSSARIESNSALNNLKVKVSYSLKIRLLPKETYNHDLKRSNPVLECAREIIVQQTVQIPNQDLPQEVYPNPTLAYKIQQDGYSAEVHF